MDRFEKDLRQALRDQPPDGSFAERVISAAATRRKQRPAKVRLWTAAVFATVIISVAVIVAFRFSSERQERLIAERAKQDVLVALRITREKLQTVEDRLADRLADTAH